MTNLNMNWLENSHHFCRQFETALEQDAGKTPFWQLAQNHLSSIDWVKDFSIMEVLYSFIDKAPEITQLNAHSVFGQPPVTLFSSEKHSFLLDLYIWENAHTSIHEHSFEGAFVVLQGVSVECSYTFLESKSNHVSSLGDLIPKEMKILRPGQVQPIHSFKDLIHRVLHLERPTISLVLRTKGVQKVQLQYFINCLASPTFPSPDVIIRLRVLEWLANKNLPIKKKHCDDLIWYREFWTLINSKPSYADFAMKLAFIHFGEKTKNFETDYCFNTLINLFANWEDKILFTAFEFYGPEKCWEWINIFMRLDQISAKKKLQDALKETEFAKKNDLTKFAFLQPLIC